MIFSRTIPVNHADYEIRGFLITLPNNKKFAFITDCKTLSQNTITKLKNVDYLALACIWQKQSKHFSHLTLEESKQLITEINAKQTWLFHISHKMGKHIDVEKQLPNNISLAYDNLKITL